MSLDIAKCCLGIEFGSTRIKAVLIDEDCSVVATGSYEWENRLENGLWTYSEDEVWAGLKDCYAKLCETVEVCYGYKITKVKAIGISGMMHGYIALDKQGKMLVPFRTWRNSNAHVASEKLTEEFQFNVPERWSISHLYQCILNGDEHVRDIDYLCTLSGYVHHALTGEAVLGVGDAAGMFPIDSTTMDYDKGMIKKFDALVADAGLPCSVYDLMPEVSVAGNFAGKLTEEGARLIDPTGTLEAGIPFCPPEGDAGTGMVATNAVAAHTGNVSAGTSIFTMVVLEKALSKLYREIDMVTTPDGLPVAMSHANNCTSDLNAWVNLFGEFAALSGNKICTDELYSMLYKEALKGDKDCSNMMSYGYLSGEFIMGLEEGRPLFVRTPHSKFNLANFMRTHLNSSIAAMKIGLELLAKENVRIDILLGHGGLFKTAGVGQQLMADALNVPISVMETAGEGGPWGMAVLASFMANGRDDETLPEYLNSKAFANFSSSTVQPDPAGVEGYKTFIANYKAAIATEKAAVASLKDVE